MRAGSPVGLIDALYGVGELTAITILAETRRRLQVPDSRDVVRYGGLDRADPRAFGDDLADTRDIPVKQSNQRRPGRFSPVSGRPRCAGCCSKPSRAQPPPGVPTTITTHDSRADRRQPRVPSGLAPAAQGSYPHSARDRRAGAHARVTQLAPAKALTQPTRRGRLSALRSGHAAIGSVVWEP